MVRALLAAGAAVDASDNKGMTALNCAAYHGHLDVVGLLVDAGANIHLIASNDRTALDAARHFNQPAVVELLLAKAEEQRAAAAAAAQAREDAAEAEAAAARAAAEAAASRAFDELMLEGGQGAGGGGGGGGAGGGRGGKGGKGGKGGGGKKGQVS